ncbi:MAG: hypothetical protein K0R39_2570 [Symbiobacteriaceae bacterium]|jgi:predicted acylesterase/phospholipase RssA|nr:hypothetical protein [Symbiobacteriaceae bacterium]
MFGGLALAVYMNGVVQELLEIVRASQRGEESGSEYWPLLEAAGARFVIDVIAGTSAGGLNGLVLAKALAVGSDAMTGMSDLWRTEAQIDKLVRTDDPQAILSGEIMEKNLEAVMRRMSATADPALATQVKVLDLFVTATDLHGRQVRHREIFGRETVQLRNSHLFHFRKRTLGTPDGKPFFLDGRKASRSYFQNDFLSEDTGEGEQRDRLLALVGRATSAFPGAFPPQQITRAEAEAARLVHLLPDEERRAFWFSDGGILMNKPFEPVVRTIFQRSADKPVERVLLWVDPDPPMGLKAQREGEPHLLQILGGLPGVLTNEDVVSYLEQVDRQNEYRRQVTAGFRTLEERLAEAAAGAAGPMDRTLEGYRSVRALRALEELKGGFRAALRGVADSERMVEALVSPIAPPELLELWDCPYQIRRMHYLLLRLNQYVAEVRATDGHAAPQALTAAGLRKVHDRQQTVCDVQQYFWNALEDWRNARWVIAHARTQTDDPTVAHQMKELVATWGRRPHAAREALDAVHSYLLWVAKRAEGEVEKAWDLLCGRNGFAARDSGLGAHLQEVYNGFEHRDVLLLPLTREGEVAEWDAIDPVLMAPGPTRRVNRPAHAKLASEVLGHLGGFFDPRWRSNDIMWGRLEAAELLCSLVVKEAGKHLPAAAARDLERVGDVVVANRHRKILTQEKEILDVGKLKARYAQMVAEAAGGGAGTGAGGFAPAQAAAAAAASAAASVAAPVPARPAAAPALAAEPSLDEVLTSAPMEVLWAYLTLDHNIGEEGMGHIRKGVLVNGFLHGLDNLTTALGRGADVLPPALKALRLALLLVLKPTRLLLGIILPWAGPPGAAARAGWLGGAVAVTFALGWAWVAGRLDGAPHTLVDPVWGWGFAGLAAAAWVLMALFGRLPRTSPPSGGIVAFEVAGSLSRAQALLAAWEKAKPGAARTAAFQVGADFLFLVGYAPLLALLAGLGASHLPWPWLRTVGLLVAWAQLLAGLLDAVENVGLMQVIAGTRREFWPRLARYCAIGKFALVGLAVPFVLLWLGPAVWDLTGPTVTAWAEMLQK